ncbi:MAG: copper transporter [Acidimicrobiia bacterium]
MINFRYHVVSILAVFLALAIGTVMGASFVGRGVIDNLQKRIDIVQGRVDRQRDENGRLQGENDRLNAYVEATQNFAVARTLVGVRTNVVAERGTNTETVDAQVTLLRQGGSEVPGAVWLEPAWALDSADAVQALRLATGLTNRSKPALRAAAARLLGQRLGSSAPETDDLLTKLVDAKFITLSGAAGTSAPNAADFTGPSTRVLEIGGPGHPVPRDLVPSVAAGVLDASAPVAVGEVFVASDQGPDRAAWIDAIANADALRDRISTIDDLELVEGRVGTTLALSELGLGTVGNYGIGRAHQVPATLPTVPVAK